MCSWAGCVLVGHVAYILYATINRDAQLWYRDAGACVCVMAVVMVPVIVAASYCAGHFISLLAGIIPLAAGIIVTHRFRSSYFMRSPNNWILLLFDRLNRRFVFFFFHFILVSLFPKMWSPNFHALETSRSRSISSANFSSVFECGLEFWQQNLIFCYFQFSMHATDCRWCYGIYWETIHTYGIRCRLFGLKIELKKTNKQTDGAKRTNGMAANYKLIKIIPFRIEYSFCVRRGRCCCYNNSHSVSIRTTSQSGTPEQSSI